MKHLQESLFDSDLVSKKMNIEELYGLIDRASICALRSNPFLKIKDVVRDFNTLMKDHETQKWNPNRYDSMEIIRTNPNEEHLRKLLYILSIRIKTADFINRNFKIDEKKLKNIIVNILEEYYTRPNFIVINIWNSSVGRTYTITLYSEIGGEEYPASKIAFSLKTI